MNKTRLGTHAQGLADATGGLVDDLGSPLINTDTEGGRAQTLGATIRRELLAGVANGDFSLPPDKPTSPLPRGFDENDNDLPFWSYTTGDTAGANQVPARLVRTDAAASGYEFSWTIKPGAAYGTAGATANTHYLERYLPVAASRARSFIFQPRTTWHCSAGASAGNISIWAEAQYFTRDLEPIGSPTTGSVAMTGISQEIGLQPASLAVEADAGFLRYRTGITVTGVISTTETAVIREIRMSTGEVQNIFADQNNPGTYRGSIVLAGGRLTSSVAGGAGAAGYLDAVAASSPNGRGTFSFSTAAPIGATFTGAATSVNGTSLTTLDLNIAPDTGAGIANSVSDEVTPPAGTYLLTARVVFNHESGGKYREVAIYRDSSPISRQNIRPKQTGSPDDQIVLSTVTTLDGGQTVSVRAEHDHAAAIDAQVNEFSIVRLGADW